MSKILKNTTNSDIELEIGISLPQNSSTIISVLDYIELAESGDVEGLITSGDIVVNDGVLDLNITDGINYILYPDDAERIRVESSSFTSTNVKDALEEVVNLTGNDFGLFPIWAEENAGLGNNSREYSFGNGATGNIGIPIPLNASLFAISYQAENAGTNTEIAVDINAVTVATTGPQSSNSGINILPSVVAVSAGDTVGFRTVTGGGASDVRVCAWLRIPLTSLIGVELNDLTDVNLTSETSGQVLYYNGTEWVNQTLNKNDVGLGNVDNTSDINKPISNDTQTALNLKYDASNPNGYETPVQLDARDAANRDRANHTGTQLASTISDFAATVRSTVLTGLSIINAVVSTSDTILSAIGKLQGQINNILANLFYTDQQSFTGLINDTNTLEEYNTFTANVPVTGLYKVEWDYTWSLNDTAQDFISELRVGTSVIYNHIQEPKDSAGTGITLPNTDGGTDNSGTSQRYGYHRSKVLLLNAGNNDISVYFRGSANNDKATIYEAEFSIKKWGIS